MDVKSRIEQAPACEVINLTAEERGIYTGAGLKLASFVHGKLCGFFDPGAMPYRDNRAQQVRETAHAALAWTAETDGEVWIVMCSAGQLCDPRRIVITDAKSLAHLMRALAERAIDD